MKRLLAAGCLGLLGGYCYFFSFAYGFFGLLCFAAAALLLTFEGLFHLRKYAPRIAKGLWMMLSILCGIGVLVTMATSGWILANARTDDAPQNEYVIVLGAGVNGTQPSKSLLERLRAACAYLETYPNSICIVSGGQGSNEQITEADCMQNYLLSHGIAEDRIWLEPEATNTEENLRFSLALIASKQGALPSCVTIVSSEYHLLRAKRYANANGVEAKGWAARTLNPFYRVVCTIREVPAIWKQILWER